MATKVIKRCKLKCCAGKMAWLGRHLFWGRNTKNLEPGASPSLDALHSQLQGSSANGPTSRPWLRLLPLIGDTAVSYTPEKDEGLCTF